MFDLSIAFKEKGGNEHFYFNGSAYASKAYLVNDDEKNAILGVLNGWMRDLIGGTAVFSVLITSHKAELFTYVGLFVLFNCIRYFLVRRRIKKILGNREKIACEKQTVLGHQERVSETMKGKSILHMIGAAIMILFMGVFLYFQYQETGIIWNLLGSILFICVSFFAIILSVFQSYLKIKKRDQSV